MTGASSARSGPEHAAHLDVAGASSARNGPEHAAYLDRLRAVAIVGVVILHSAALAMPSASVASTTWMTLNVYDGLVRFCVPVFFMITGALMLDPRRAVSLRSILRKSMPRIVVAYLLWSGLYAAVAPALALGEPGVRAFLERWAVGHYHLWYLWALMGLYLATPLLRRIVADRSSAVYFTLLAAIFALLMPMLTSLPVIGEPLTQILDRAQFHLVLGYTFYFVLGHLLHTGLADRLGTAWVIVIGVLGTTVTVLGTAVASVGAGAPVLDLYEYLTLNVAASAVAVFLLARRLVRPDARKTPGTRIIALLGATSFGIYLVHPLFQEILAMNGVTTGVLPAVVSVPLMALILLIPSMIVATLLRRIPRVGRFLA